MNIPPPINPEDEGLSEAAIRTRRQSRRLARLMLAITFPTAAAGWALYYISLSSATRIKEQSPYLAIIAYALLIVSSATLVLGLWYLLLAQVQRIAGIVESEDSLHASERPLCPNCGWPCDPPDRFCRHCGKALNASY